VRERERERKSERERKRERERKSEREREKEKERERELVRKMRYKTYRDLSHALRSQSIRKIVFCFKNRIHSLYL
jgi:hypothetical protein